MAKRKKKSKRKRGRPKKRDFRLKIKQETALSIVQVLFFSLAILVIISFSRQGLILVELNDILVEYLSWSTVLLPFVFFSIAFMVSKFKNPLGHPNVVVGSLLFAISIGTIGRAGTLGAMAWEGVATLITGVGAFVVLLGTSLVGLVILFNTSVDQVLGLVLKFLKTLRGFIVGEKVQKGGGLSRRREIKVHSGIETQERHDEVKPVEAKSTLSPKLVSNLPGENKVWKYPPLSILSETQAGKADRGDIKGNAAIIERTLESFGIEARVVEINQGPTVTQYALEVALGTKLSKVTTLERDLALALAAPTGAIRIEAPIPGRSLIGIELPNISAEFVPLRKMLQSEEMKGAESKLVVSLGLDVSGKPVVADLGKMPHVLIAGQTGSGKSVSVNAFLSTLLFRAAPSEVKLILVDPKRVEMTSYGGIPHLLTPVIVEPDKVVSALRWLVSEMDKRYKLFAQAGARNIASFNEMSGFQALPYIVLVIDELADIMLFAPSEVEDSITRIAQMSRATGIHMVLATQRPSVNVITGLIKANIPTRIAFAVASSVDSRVVLDVQGAEKLLGKGDMLFLPPEQAKPKRIQGAFISDKEVTDLVSHIKNQGVQPQYTEEVVQTEKVGVGAPGVAGRDVDELFEKAVRAVCQYDRASASLLQRRLSIGYARAARIIDQLEQAGAIGAADGSKPRDVLVKNADEFLASS